LVGRPFVDQVVHEKDYFHLDVKPEHGKGENSGILGTYIKNINKLDEKYWIIHWKEEDSWVDFKRDGHKSSYKSVRYWHSNR
jgi:hypothetical protein